MARKRLSDLLREEVQKPTENQPELDPPNGVDAELVEAAPPDAIATNEHAAELQAAQQREATLKQQIADLTQHVADLTQQLADLKAEAKTQAPVTKKLQASLEKAEQRNSHLDAELTEAKQTALQLADRNAQLQQQLETLQKNQPTHLQSTKASPPTTRSTPGSQPQSEDRKLATKPLSQQEVLRRRQADSLAHPMFPAGKSPGQLTDQDIGWVD